MVQYTRNSKVHSVYVRKTEPKGINAFNMFTGKNQDIRIAEMEDMMENFDNKIFDLVCEKDKIETRLKFAEISATIFYEEYQIVNQENSCVQISGSKT